MKILSRMCGKYCLRRFDPNIFNNNHTAEKLFSFKINIENLRKKAYNIIMKKPSVLAAVIIAAMLLPLLACCNTPANDVKPGEKPQLSVWWWDNRLDPSFLDFAKQNDVTEIYCYYSSFSQKTTDFIAAAEARGIEVLWLAGKYEWIEDYPSLKSEIEDFVAFQSSSPSKFAGVHLDIEPHQHPYFESRREELITEYVELTFSLRRDFPSLRIEYDIPFWLDDEVTVNGSTKPAHEFVIDNATRVTVMSYRDSAEKILDCAKDEINYAKSAGKPLNLSVETGENEDDIVTFYEEGCAYMLEQLAAVRTALPVGFGIAIHHIGSWRSLTE